MDKYSIETAGGTSVYYNAELKQRILTECLNLRLVPFYFNNFSVVFHCT